MTRYLPDDRMICTAYYYASRSGMVSVPLAPGDLEFLAELGLRAAALACWEGLAPQPVPEGPYLAHQWPERIWDEVASAMAQHAAEHGDYGPEAVIPPSGPFSRGWQESEDAAWGGQRPSATYAEWWREGKAREEGRILAGAYGPDEVIPPWCPLPQGEQALRNTGY